MCIHRFAPSLVNLRYSTHTNSTIRTGASTTSTANLNKLTTQRSSRNNTHSTELNTNVFITFTPILVKNKDSHSSENDEGENGKNQRQGGGHSFEIVYERLFLGKLWVPPRSIKNPNPKPYSGLSERGEGTPPTQSQSFIFYFYSVTIFHFLFLFFAKGINYSVFRILNPLKNL